jgi:hypothetical protein
MIDGSIVANPEVSPKQLSVHACSLTVSLWGASTKRIGYRPIDRRLSEGPFAPIRSLAASGVARQLDRPVDFRVVRHSARHDGDQC